MEDNTKRLPYPKAVGFIVTNEFCERFSYYGMRTILSLYLRDKLNFDDDSATIIYHVFTMFAYFFPLLGAMIADGWLGRFRTIMYLSIVYALGSILISLTAVTPIHLPQLGLTIVALLLIAFGTGGIKPCVSAFGGDQFKLPEQERYLATFFSLFYFSINAGSLISTFITPILRSDVKCFGDNDCYSLAFGVPGILMIVSLFFFVIGKRWYMIKNPSGNLIGRVGSCMGHAIVAGCKTKEKRDHWLDHADDKYDKGLIEDIKAMLRVLVLFIPLPVFWALFDQQGSRWTFQADRMYQEIGSWTLKADQMQVLNPLLILLFIPVFEVAIYPFLHWCKLVRKPLHRMIWGGFLAALAFVISGIVELSLVPTYGTPVADGVAQLRVYNGYNCNLTVTLNTAEQNIIANIGPLDTYEKLDFETDTFLHLPYSMQGQNGSSCSNVAYNGLLSLAPKTANSFFVDQSGVHEFVDNNDKVIDGVNVRFLANLQSNVEIKLASSRNTTSISLNSSDTSQKNLEKGKYDILIDNIKVINSWELKTGAVYAVLVTEENENYYVKPVEITPPNTIHILWLIPQYVILTMGEVMFSVTGLEFSFTQAPASMKSVVTSMWLLTVAFGNLIVVLIVEGNFLDAQWKEFFLFAGLMAADMIVFSSMAVRYKYIDMKSSTEDLAIEKPEKKK